MMASRRLSSVPVLWLSLGLLGVAFGMPYSKPLFSYIFSKIDPPVFGGASFIRLLASHAEIVLLSTGAAVLIGVSLGVFATRAIGRQFLGLIRSVTAIGLTFPPAAVLALAVPVMGFGARPTILALALYALLPIVENTIAGLESVPAEVTEAAAGQGFSPFSCLWKVELPLAAPVIIAGIRTAAIINIGTAAIGSTMGALTLGTPIIDGLVSQKLPYVIQGSVLVALFAMWGDAVFASIARKFETRTGTGTVSR